MNLQHAAPPDRVLAARQSPDALLSIVLPVYNEARVLRTLVEQVQAAARRCGMRHEIILVNDGSRDLSGEILDELAATHRDVRVLHLSRNFGHQAAVHAGLTHAAGAAVVLMDSDLQDSPLALPQFVSAWRQGADVVYAIRAERKEALWKRFLFAAFHRFLSRLSHGNIPCDAGNFSLMDRAVLEHVTSLMERDRYLPGLRSWVGFKQLGIRVERQARYDDTPRVSLCGLFRLAKTAILSFSTFPLTVFYLIGLCALALFAGLAGFSLFCKLCTNLAIPGWTSHILSASFFGALNALGISILGEYVVRIYDQVRGRPIYIVRRKVNFATADESASQYRTYGDLRGSGTVEGPLGESGEQPYGDALRQVTDLLALLARRAEAHPAQQPEIPARAAPEAAGANPAAPPSHV